MYVRVCKVQKHRWPSVSDSSTAAIEVRNQGGREMVGASSKSILHAKSNVTGEIMRLPRLLNSAGKTDRRCNWGPVQ